ncbi:MAG: DegV family protein [Clostridia bacterium]|nr:DegV family protein [Clostridia bacterium]
MIKIIADTSTLLSSAQAKEKCFTVAPLSVTVNGATYKELDEISSMDFVKIVREGHIPTSSQPAIGDILALFDGADASDDVINIAMAHGLSGTYQSACSAAEMSKNKDNITVINSKTLCGPHRYMVEKAQKMVENGCTKDEIIAAVNKCVENGLSFLIPEDFDFLRRGGRLAPLASFIGGALKLVPVMTLTEDCTRLIKAGLVRNFQKALNDIIIPELKKDGTDENYLITISHADNMKRAEIAKAELMKHFPNTEIEIVLLTPAFITQGGPGCVAIQSVLK